MSGAESGQMKKPGQLPLIVAGILFSVYFANVAIGAFSSKPFLGDIAEMLTLLASSVVFAIATLQIEAAQSNAQDELSET